MVLTCLSHTANLLTRCVAVTPFGVPAAVVVADGVGMPCAACAEFEEFAALP